MVYTRFVMHVSKENCHLQVTAQLQQSSTTTQKQQLKVPERALAGSRLQGRLAQAQTGPLPATVEDMQRIIAANCPIFYFHPEERCGRPDASWRVLFRASTLARSPLHDACMRMA